MGTNIKRDIVVELSRARSLQRHPCHVCGGCTEKVEVLAEVASGPHKGLRVCESFLEDGDIDAILKRQAEELRKQAAAALALVGRLKVPTFAEWEAAAERADVESWMSHRSMALKGCDAARLSTSTSATCSSAAARRGQSSLPRRAATSGSLPR